MSMTQSLQTKQIVQDNFGGMARIVQVIDLHVIKTKKLLIHPNLLIQTISTLNIFLSTN